MRATVSSRLLAVKKEALSNRRRFCRSLIIPVYLDWDSSFVRVRQFLVKRKNNRALRSGSFGEDDTRMLNEGRDTMKMKSAWIALAAVSVLSGCATAVVDDGAGRLTETDKIVQGAMAENRAEINTTWNYIRRMEQTEREQAAAKAAALASASARAAVLDTQLKIVWKDDSAEDLLKQLAEQLGLDFQIRGEPRALPRVTVEGEVLTVRRILEKVGDRIDRVADVVLVKAGPSEKARLELRFK